MSGFLAALLLSLLLIVGTNGDEECKLGAIDLVFVMDESKSVGADNFQLGLNAAAQLTSSLTIGTKDELDKSRVGFVLFGNNAELGFRLDDYATNDAVARAIKAQKFGGGGTNIADGMDYATKNVFVPTLRNASRMMLIITDGRDSTDVALSHDLAWENDITVYALGVGSEIDMVELYNATGSMNRIYTVDDYSGLSGAMRNICQNIAPPIQNAKSCGCEDDKLDEAKYWLDVIYVIDSSDGVSDEDFSTMKRFLMLMATMNPKTATSGDQYTRMAIINTAVSATDFLTLNSGKTSAEIRSYIQKSLVKKGGTKFDPQSGLERALDMITEEQEAGRRENVRKAVVMFSTASIDCHRQGLRAASGNETDVLCELTSVMEDDSTTLIAVGLKLAGSDDFPYIDIVNKCNALDNTLNMMQDVMRALCRANCYCLDPYTQFAIGQGNCEKYGECLYVEELSLPYSAAKATCEDQNDILATVYNQQKDDFLRNLHLSAQFYPYWIGMTCPGGKCVGTDGSTISADSYLNWCKTKGQPNFQAGECVYEDTCSNFDSGWFIAKCGNFMPDNYFSCQRDSCSVSNYCKYLNKGQNQKISKRKAIISKSRRSKLHRWL